MNDCRYKKLMKDFGMPNSRSLLQLLQQVANEVAQECHATYKKSKMTKASMTKYQLGVLRVAVNIAKDQQVESVERLRLLLKRKGYQDRDITVALREWSNNLK